MLSVMSLAEDRQSLACVVPRTLAEASHRAHVRLRLRAVHKGRKRVYEFRALASGSMGLGVFNALLAMETTQRQGL